MKGVSAEGRKQTQPDAETSLIFISPRLMTTGFGSGFFVIPNHVLKQDQDLSISGSRC
jgi:hypothetical protein